MDKVMSAADKVLSLLPFNGDKTVIGAGLKLLLPLAVVKFPPLLVVAPVIDAIAEMLLAFGLGHKVVKAVGKEK